VQISDCGARLCGRLVTSNDQTTMVMGETLNQRGVEKLFVLAPNYAAGKDMAAGAHFIFSLNHGAVTKLPRIASADHAALIPQLVAGSGFAICRPQAPLVSSAFAALLLPEARLASHEQRVRAQIERRQRCGNQPLGAIGGKTEAAHERQQNRAEIGVCTENLNTGVVVMKSAQHGTRTDHTGSLNGARNRRILVQGSMRSDAIVIVGVGFQDPTQMHLTQDNDVVHALTPDRSDQPLGNAVLPRRGWCGGLVPDAHGAQSARDDAAIDPVAIADEVVRSLIPRKCLRDLTCNPFGRRICCDVDPDEVSAV
jgi:hypothetical protein